MITWPTTATDEGRQALTLLEGALESGVSHLTDLERMLAEYDDGPVTSGDLATLLAARRVLRDLSNKTWPAR